MRRRLVGQTVRVAGLCFVVCAIAAALSPRAPAYAQALAHGVQVAMQEIPPMQNVIPLGTPTPTPSPSPAPTLPGLQSVRGGPLTYTFSGSLSFGARLESSAFGGAFPAVSISPSASPTPVAGFQNTSTTNSTSESLGFQAEVTRRTGTTVTDLRIPVSFGTNGAELATVAAFYSTPKYSLAYAPMSALLFGQLPLGGTFRGFSLIVPEGYGDETLYEGPSEGVNGENIGVLGYRLRVVNGSSFYEAGVTAANGVLTGKSDTLSFGAALQQGNLGLVGEGAWQERVGGDGDPHGLAYQVMIDDGALSTAFTTTIRHIPDAFVSFGGGENYGDDFLDMNYRAGAGSSGLLLDGNFEETGSTIPGQVNETRVVTGAYTLPLSFGQFGLALQQQRLYTNAPPASITNTNTAGIQFSGNGVPVSLGAEFDRQLNNINGNLSQISYNLETVHAFGKYTFTFGGQYSRATQTGIAPVKLIVESLTLGRSFGKTTVSLGTQASHSLSAESLATTLTPLLTITRQISPALSVGATGGYTFTHDPLNPTSDGSSRVFSLQFNAPFSYGNGPVVGRNNPHLPATIQGKVAFAQAQGTNAAAAFTSIGGTSGGVPNVEVVLDDKYVERTDLTGGFEYPFLTAGQHQIRIEAASMPRGFTVDPPVMTINLLGGQSQQVTFTVGNFGGILGRVYGFDQAGHEQPLSNVRLRLDGGPYSTTDGSGRYGFGHLGPGKHKVEVIASTVPAFATFPADKLTQTVDVSNGFFATLDFAAEPLGSIAGSILFGPDVKNATGGVQNAYVVAEPGEYAAIDDQDGSFIIDNLPPGDYTLSVDPETLPEGLGAGPESLTVHLGPGDHVTGENFTVGHFNKKVVFTFMSGNASAAVAGVHLGENKLPPGGSTTVTIDAPSTARDVAVKAFGNRIPLQYDKSLKEWAAQLEVPEHEKAGSYSVDASIASGVPPKSAQLTVDPQMPIATITYTPTNAPLNSYIHVRARFLVDAREGDEIRWEDGRTTILGKPVSGRVFTMEVFLSLRPLHGVLLTKGGSLPIVIM